MSSSPDWHQTYTFTAGKAVSSETTMTIIKPNCIFEDDFCLDPSSTSNGSNVPVSNGKTNLSKNEGDCDSSSDCRGRLKC